MGNIYRSKGHEETIRMLDQWEWEAKVRKEIEKADQGGGNDYRANLQDSSKPVQDIFEAIHTARENGNLDNLYDVIVPNGYGSGIYNNYSKELTIGGHEFKLRVHGFSDRVSESYYDIYQAGFGYLDRFSSYTPSPKFNGGYYQGFFMTGYDRQYFITIGANSNSGYEYLKNLYKR